MQELHFPLTLILRKLDDQFLLGEALLVPEISTLDDNREMLVGVLRRLCNEWLEKRPLLDLWRHRAPQLIVAETLLLEVEPWRRQLAWLQPVLLKLPVVRWEQTPTMHVAYLPTLGIEVLAETAEDLAERVPAHAHSALLRTGIGKSLWQLSLLQRCTEIELVTDLGALCVRSPKEQAKQAAAEEERALAGRTTLEQVATDMAKLVQHTAPEFFEIEDHTDRIAELLTGTPRRSVLLVGPSGVGKTAAVNAMFQRRLHYGLDQTPFWMTSGSRLVAGASGFGMWEDRCQKLCQDVAKIGAILHLGNLVELMEVGRSEFRSQSIAAFLRPRILRGELVAIAECTPEQFALVEREEPQLLSAFIALTIPEPDEARTRSIITQFAALHGKSVSISALALDKLQRLHRRYATYSVNPSRPLRFLKSLFSDQYRRKEKDAAVHSREITVADVTRGFAKETGLPLWLLEETEPFDLTKAREWFRSRVMGQDHAVDLVVDLIATVKAALARPCRPLASLLFIGPTGVGKTEMAKSLAEFLFSNSQRLTRFDMSEFADPIAVQRLIGGAFGSEGLLTTKVREQPFSVLLFDEFEKADPLFFDLLLQVLGEARLTDGAGRVADFSNTVIVMTSNLGAASFQRGAAGFVTSDVSPLPAYEHFSREVRQFVRPELFNRLDRIVPFAPLSEETTRDIVRRQLALLRQRDGLRYRDVELVVDDAVVPHLARLGYDRRYGARTLKRVMERELFVPLAERLNSFAVELPLRAAIAVELERITCEVHNRDRLAPRAAGVGAPVDVRLTESYLTLRRSTQRLQQCPAMLELRNTIFLLQRQQDRIVDYQYVPSEDDRRRLERLSRLHEREFSVDELQRRVVASTESLLIDLYSSKSVDTALYQEELAALEHDFHQALLELYLQGLPEPNAVTVAVLSEDGPVINWLGKAYFEASSAIARRLQVWSLWPAKPDSEEREPIPAIPWEEVDTSQFQWNLREPEPGDTETIWELNWKRDDEPPIRWLERHRIDEPEELFSQPFEPGLLGLLLEVEGPAVTPRLMGENGWYRWLNQQAQRHVFVETGPGAINAYLPPFGIDRRGTLVPGEIRRTYDETNGWLVESPTKRKSPWSRGRLGALLAEILERQLQENVRSLIADAD